MSATPYLTRPFLKWAGGKGQLLGAIDAALPPEIRTGEITTYVEPFIGGGAVFFHLAQRYPLRQFFLFDMNPELVLTYRTVRDHVEAVIEALENVEREYLRGDEDARRRCFYAIRRAYNEGVPRTGYDRYQPEWIERTAQMLFLNRTCFNGLFRVNSRGEFNVPFGRYRNPTICSSQNLRAASALLQHALIRMADFEACAEYVHPSAFVYFDPPYRPLSKTASFNAYSRHEFDDREQERLARFFRRLHGVGARLMLSNSDPRNTDPDDRFFDDLYAGFHVRRVPATRLINSNPDRRGEICELLITNW